MSKINFASAIKQKALELGFISCGISKSEFLEEEAPRIENWLKKNMHGSMHYMQNHFELRLNPSLLVSDAKSVISVLYNYFPEQDLFQNSDLKISKYAYGEDYHQVVKSKLNELLSFIKDQVGDIQARCFTDSAPVLEKTWASKSGLGWIGKNANLISQKTGSFFFLGEIICDLELDYDGPTTDHCGTCTACIDSCPTEAIIKPYVVDGSKCISYATIELKEEIIPKNFNGKMDGWIFGCDICQDVCPWNRFSKPNTESRFTPLINPDQLEIAIESVESFHKIFRKSAVKRTGFKGLLRNIEFASKNKKNGSL